MYLATTSHMRKLLQKDYGIFMSSTAFNIGDENNEIELESPCTIGNSVELMFPCKVGAFTNICDRGLIWNFSMGRYCSVAGDVNICLGNHPTDWLSISPFQYIQNFMGWIGNNPTQPFQNINMPKDAKVNIGNDVWIGYGAKIMAGVTIGDGAVIGTGAIVTKDVPPYAIVVGVPAKIIRYRFDEATIAELLELKWWRFAPGDLNGIAFSDIHLAIAQIKERIANGQLKEYQAPILTRQKLIKMATENSKGIRNKIQKLFKRK